MNRSESDPFSVAAVLLLLGSVSVISIGLCIRNSKSTNITKAESVGVAIMAILEALTLPITIITLTASYVILLYVFKGRRHH
jgi:hypothetical protein